MFLVLLKEGMTDPLGSILAKEAKDIHCIFGGTNFNEREGCCLEGLLPRMDRAFQPPTHLC